MEFPKAFWADDFFELVWVLRKHGTAGLLIEWILPETVDLRRTYYDNGQLMKESTYKDGEEHGLCKAWYSNGQPAGESTWEDGVKI